MAYIIGIIIVVLIAVGFAMNRSDNETTSQTTSLEETVTPTGTEINDNEPTNTPNVSDGTHNTSATYFTPANKEYLLDVTLTTENDVITEANIIYSQGAENDPNAQRFEAAYKSEVIGKKIDELDLARIGGASLTTSAFNKAVANILADNTQQ